MAPGPFVVGLEALLLTPARTAAADAEPERCRQRELVVDVAAQALEVAHDLARAGGEVGGTGAGAEAGCEGVVRRGVGRRALALGVGHEPAAAVPDLVQGRREVVGPQAREVGAERHRDRLRVTAADGARGRGERAVEAVRVRLGGQPVQPRVGAHLLISGHDDDLDDPRGTPRRGDGVTGEGGGQSRPEVVGHLQPGLPEGRRLHRHQDHERGAFHRR